MTDPLKTIRPEKQAEASALDAIFQDVTGWKPKLWRSTIGYGIYHYREPSGREGEFFATGFNMRVRDISLHILPGYSQFPDIEAKLGPHRRGKSCWYIKTLEGVDDAVLRELITAGLDDLRQVAEV
ncbi:MAG: DUF1801 domain-containing protein, partial [Pseudomonadota bacterium]